MRGEKGVCLQFQPQRQPAENPVVAVLSARREVV